MALSKKSLKSSSSKKSVSKKNSSISGKQLKEIPTQILYDDFSELSEKIVFQGVKTNNLKNIDIVLPKNKIITITGVSGSGKSSLAFDTIYKEGQFRYIESLSSYLRQFFNLWERPDLEYCSWLSPAIAIEQNKRGWNTRSTVGTLTELDDYIRLLFAKVGDSYCYNCGNPIRPQTVEQILTSIQESYLWKKLYLLKESGSLKSKTELQKFVKNNKLKVEKGTGFTRYLLMTDITEEVSIKDSLISNDSSKKRKKTSSSKMAFSSPVEYFYLEDPVVSEDYFPLKVYWIYDRITVENQRMPRLKEDIIKILWESKKFWVYVMEENAPKREESPLSAELLGTSNIEISTKKKDKKGVDYDVSSQKNTITKQIQWFTDKMFCPNCNITYPEFTTQHFSPNRQEGACPHCHGIGEVLQVDFDKIIEPTSPLKDAILPWRDSNLWQGILRKLAEKYSMNLDKPWQEQPEWFLHALVYGDNELIRVPVGWKWTSMYYQGMEEIIKEQYSKWLLTVDFQAMLDMKPCSECFWSKLKKESLHVFLTFPQLAKNIVEALPNFSNFFIMQDDLPFAHPLNDGNFKINIWDLQKIPLKELGDIIQLFVTYTSHPHVLIERITKPLIDRISTIDELGLAYLMTIRQIDTLSGWEIQRLRLAKQLGNKLTGIVYVLDEPTIGLDIAEIERTITSIRKLKAMGNTIIVVEHNEEFIEASDWVVEIGPGAGDFGGELVFNGSYQDFLKSDCLTAKYLRGEKTIDIDFSHTPSNKRVKISKASKHNLADIDVKLNLGSFTVITWGSGAGKTTLMYTTLYRFLNDKEKFVQSYIRLQLLKKWLSWEEILAAPVMRAEEYHHFENLALQEFYLDLGVDKIQGYEEIKNTIYVDQSSIWKTPRSCPATFVNVFDKIRLLYAGTTEAKYLGFNNSYFSFNSDKGACPACNWYWYKKIELQFLPDTYVPCELCHGQRYKPEILAIKRRGKTIAEVLDMYISDALEFFSEIDHIRDELQLLCDIWLGYLRMGQSAHTLSGWESQRLKLVKHLLKDYRGHSVYFLDEPTVGLHLQDIEKLLKVLKVFLERGDTILMIEHDQSILKYADHIIRLNNWTLVE